MTRILYIILFLSIQTVCVSQHDGKTISKKEWNNMVIQQSRQSFSAYTRNILNELNSLLTIDSTLEFRTVGEASIVSTKFQKYGQLVKRSSET